MNKTILLGLIIMISIFSLSAKTRKKNIDNLPLMNTKWVLEEVFETVVTHNNDTAFITFSENYKFSGNLSCNLFFGEFSYGKKRLKLDYFGATKKYCKDMSLEELFLKAIKLDKFTYFINRNTMFFFHKKNMVCKFEGKLIVNENLEENHEDSN